MSEREIRTILQRVCGELDERLRVSVGRGIRGLVVPAAVAVSLSLTAGCAVDEYGVPLPTDTVTVADPGPQPDYMAPDVGPQPEYMVADVGPQPDYMAPDVMPVYGVPDDAEP